MKTFILITALTALLLGCGERKVEPQQTSFVVVEHVLTVAPTQAEVEILLRSNVWWIENERVTCGLLAERVRNNWSAQLSVYDGMARRWKTYSWVDDFFWTKREADSALCASLQARMDSLREGGK